MNEKKPEKRFDEMDDEELAKTLFGERATDEIKRELRANEADKEEKKRPT